MAITTIEAVAAWLSHKGVQVADADVFQPAYEAAEAFVADRCVWPVETTEGPVPAPSTLVMAVNLQTARYLERRDSPFGMVGMADGTVGQIGATDQDVRAAMAPYRRVVFG